MTITVRWTCLIVLIWGLVEMSGSMAAPVLTVNEGLAGRMLGRYAAVFLDDSRILSITDIRERTLAWNDWNRDAINIGLTSAAVWVRFEVENIGDKPVSWFLDMGEALIRDIHVYRYGPDGRQDHRVSGFAHPFPQRDIAMGVPLFRLEEPPHSRHGYWLYLAPATTAHRLLMRGWQEHELAPALNRLGIAHGIWYGALLIMSAYNLVLACVLRERTYGWFAVNIGMAALAQASYSGKLLSWLDGVRPDQVLALNFAIFSLMAMAGMQMTRHFLELARTAPRQDRLCRGMNHLYGSILLILAIPGFPTGWIGPLMNIISLPANLLICFVAIHAWRKGYRPARFFILAWLGATVGTAIFSLRNLGILDITPWTSLAYPLGVLSGLVLFSVALADRIRTWQKEREAAQLALLEERREIERVLETRVIERTESLCREKERADAANRLKDRFVALVAHDLRSPLSSLKQALARLNGAVSGVQQERTTLKQMDGTVCGLLDLLDQLLDLNRLKTGRLSLWVQPLDVCKLVNEQLSRIDERARTKGVILHNACTAQDFFRGDAVLMGQVVANLLDNAIKFCRPGDRVVIRSIAGEYSGFEVADSGAGFPKDWQGIPPGQFCWMKEEDGHARRQGGFGLGLALCEAIVAAHGGCFTAETAPEGGACFRIGLPLYRPGVLLVEMSATISPLLQNSLQTVWPELIIHACDNAERAMDYLVRHQPDFIVCDQALPDMQGLTLIGQLRQQSRYDAVPMVLTASVDSDEAFTELECRSARIGADALLRKPIVLEQWLAVWQELREVYRIHPSGH